METVAVPTSNAASAEYRVMFVSEPMRPKILYVECGLDTAARYREFARILSWAKDDVWIVMREPGFPTLHVLTPAEAFLACCWLAEAA